MNQSKIHSHVFLLQDVAAVLRALYDVHVQALRGAARDEYQAGYEAGFAAAIRAAATALHIDASFVGELPGFVAADFRVLPADRQRLAGDDPAVSPEISAARIVGHLQ